MKAYIVKGAAVVGAIGLLVAPVLSLAQGGPGGGVVPLPNPQGYGTPSGFLLLVTRILNWVFTFLLALAVIFVLYAAFIYLTAGGDAEKVGRANKIILYAAIAIAIAVLARAVPAIVGSLLGANTTPTV